MDDGNTSADANVSTPSSKPISVFTEVAPEAPAEVSTELPPVEPSVPKTTHVSPEAPLVEPTAHIPVDEPLPQPPPPPAFPLPPPTPITATPNVETNRTKLVQARAIKQDRKRKKLDRILEELATKDSITNDEVEKILHVSDATATRYLSQLKKEGKIQQVGKTGHTVKYKKL